MLDQLKKNMTKKNLVAWIVFGAIILVFVFFGFRGNDMGGGAGYAARVNNELISIRDFQNATENMSRYKFLYGDGPEADKAIRNNAINQLIDLELVSQYAQANGLRVTDEEVADQIMNTEGFMENGKFQRANYERYLQYDNMFEKRLRKQLLSQKVMNLLQTSFIVSDLEIEKSKQLKSNQAVLEFIKLEPVKNEKLKEEDVKTQINDIVALYASNAAEAVKRAQALGLKWEDTGPFTMEANDIPKIGRNSQLIADAFTFEKGQLPAKLYDSYGAQFIVRLKEKKTLDLKEGDAAQMADRIVAYPRVNSILTNWKSEIRAKSSVDVNPTVIRMLE